jgi:hypothetical protein
MKNIINILFILTAILFNVEVTAIEAPDSIGEVVFARGAVSAQVTGQEIRILGKKAAIYQGDTITTGKKSFAVIKLQDDSRFSLRPNTVFAVEEFAHQQDQESAVMRLFKGGLRAVSGLIGKRNPKGFKLKTSVATIGIRGTVFDARLCDGDCSTENQKYKKVETVTSTVIAKIAYLKGQITASNVNNTKRSLDIGSSLYEGDTLESDKDSFAVIAFNDKSRVTLKAESQFEIERHRYSPDQSGENSAVYRLIKGGVRALTGLISQYKKESYRIKTPTATIGIRGTGFDLLWRGPCSASPKCGLVGFVWDGGIFAKNERGSWDLSKNKVILVRFPDQPAEFLDVPPVFNVPRPDEVDIDFDNLFSRKETTEIEPGLYVGCYEGECFLVQGDRTIDLTAGQTGFASRDGLVLTKFEHIEAFQQRDPYLQTINEELETLFELLDDSVIEQNEFECIVQ